MLKFNELKKQTVESDADMLRHWHHVLMKEYGWIHPDDFKKLPIPFVISMLEEIGQDYKEMERMSRRFRK